MKQAVMQAVAKEELVNFPRLKHTRLVMDCYLMLWYNDTQWKGLDWQKPRRGPRHMDDR